MILVTGGTGLVGSHLLYKLTSTNNSVRAIYRTEHKLAQVKDVFATYTNDFEALFNKIEWVQADLLDITALELALSNIDIVYHCAAFVSFEPDKYHLLRKTNIEGTSNLVNICLSKNIKKLCYVSSIATLGKPTNSLDINEETVWNPEDKNTVYAITKYGAEMEVWRATQEGLNAVIVNPGVILGAGIWKYGTGSLFKKASKGNPFYTSGSVGLVDVHDVVEIMIKLMESNIINERFILVAETWSFKDFLEKLAISVNGKIPKKEASKFLLDILWRLDWFVHKITGKRRQLTRHLTNTLCSKRAYSNAKIKTALNYNFRAVNDTITEIGSLYLKRA
ncbi:NAD-dependent epimerase/dehydratase family protein [Aestuariibaculum sediminum]|uniref:NAD-dependent epimerase/dehydratase family protein n=1 Tax=Aestuariibaculum sediminum TaxID=2770637 RepID=A0A8J6Q7U8_9FLAO|nr:NAD-dependent epimerase/dehydratase family protein [Aestuariibaculum sediminum]MBD0830937.1 NAD-dependent epimerase/dehydratase family protein [Aestuariibaculum sediminum]